jgi:hypothetical protein
MTLKEQILAKIAEVDEMLFDAECDKVQLAEIGDVWAEVQSAVAQLQQVVDYYLD